VTTPDTGDSDRVKAEISEQSPSYIATLDTAMRITWVNTTLSRLRGIPAQLWVGRELGRMLPGLDVEGVEGMLRHVVETGERLTDVEHRGPLLRDRPTNQVWGCSALRLEDGCGTVEGVALVATDMTRRSQDRERLTLLNETSERIGSTLDIARTAEETLDVLVPALADFAIINVLSYVLDGGPPPNLGEGAEAVRMEIVAVRWASGRQVPEELAKGSVSYLDPSSKFFEWLVAGQTIFEPTLPEVSTDFSDMLESEFFRRRFQAWARAGVRSGMIVPISARGAILGTVALLRVSERVFTDRDVALAEDVLARSAICLDNARVYSRERAVALELQRSMLPRGIGVTPGVELAYRYEPANVAAEIGGDWFDVVPHPDGCIALIVGDVTGHDIHAATLMGQIRTATRTLSTLDLSPVEVLTRLDAMISDMGVEVGATCVYAAFRPETRHCVIARAGHPPPALVRSARHGGGVEFLDLPACLPLGVGGGEFESVELTLEPGCVLVLYTDGLIESRHASIDVGMENLARALAAARSERFGHRFAAALINRLVPDPADDIALLLARVAEDDEA
jgi:hypothetical protein